MIRKSYLIFILLLFSKMMISQVIDLGTTCTENVLDYLDTTAMIVGEQLIWIAADDDTILQGPGSDGVNNITLYKNGNTMGSGGTIAQDDEMMITADIVGVDAAGTSGGGTGICGPHAPMLVVVNAYPTLCTKDVLDGILANGGMVVGEVIEWISADTDTYIGSSGGNAYDANWYQNNVNVNGLAFIVAGDTMRIEAVSVGVDEVLTGNGNCPATPNMDLVVNAAMPVAWLKPLNAIHNNGKVELKWSVAQQINNEKFVIEHSNDWREFSVIGQVDGEGNYPTEMNYEYFHKSPSVGMNYYRLKQVDYDGRYEYSNIASVNYESKEFRVYPNPVNNELVIHTANDRSIEIYNQIGVKQIKQMLETRENRISVSQLPTGIYYYRIGEETGKFVKE